MKELNRRAFLKLSGAAAALLALAPRPRRTFRTHRQGS